MYFEFWWELLTGILKSAHKWHSLCSISLPRSRLWFTNLNGSNWLRDVKCILFRFIILGFTLAISLNKNIPLNSKPFNLTNSSQTCLVLLYNCDLWFFGFADLMENLHGNLCEDMLLVLNQKDHRCLQCSHLRLGFQHILGFCGKIGFPVVLLSKWDLVQLENVLFLCFF